MIRGAQGQIQYTVYSWVNVRQHMTSMEPSFPLDVQFWSLLWLTVSEVKVRQMPPKPFRDSAKKMSADNTANKKKKKKSGNSI